MPKIPEIKLVLAAESREAEEIIGFRYADEEVGTRSKLGGEPDWIQKSDTPICSCGSAMTFYGQLDSIGDQVCLADCGMIYVFVCMDCFETASVLQSS